MNDTVEAPRRGRPPKDEVKKGKPTWKPANVDDVFDKETGYRYRWLNKDPKNLAKKKAEHWEIVSEANGAGTTSEAGYGRIDAGKPLTTVRESYDRVLAKIPEDLAQERDAHYNAETSRRMAGLTRQTKEGLSQSDAPIHGSISIEQRGIRTVIKE